MKPETRGLYLNAVQRVVAHLDESPEELRLGRRALFHIRLSVGLGGTGNQKDANRQFESGASQGFREAAFVQNKSGKPEKASTEPGCASDQVGVWRLDDETGHTHGEEETTVGRPDLRHAETPDGLD